MRVTRTAIWMCALLLGTGVPAHAAKVVWSSAAVKKPAAPRDTVAAAASAVTPKPAEAAVPAPDSAARRTPPAAVPPTAAVAPAAVPPARPAATVTPAAATAPASAIVRANAAPAPTPAAPAPARSVARAETTAEAPARVTPPAVTRPREAAVSRQRSRISYLAGRSAYVDAGQFEGLAVGDTVNVERDGVAIAALRVSFVSTHRASCDTLWTRRPLVVGDAVGFWRDLRRQAATEDSVRTAQARVDSIRRVAVLAPPKGRAAVRNARTRGRIGGRWLSVATDAGARYQQPALELRAEQRDALSGHMDAIVDIRGRRTMRSSDAGTQVEQYSRVYRAAVTLRDERDHRRLTLGRQSSPTLASISLFDGGLAETGNDRHTYGVFAGTQPDPVRYRWSHELVEAGGFVEWHQKPLSAQRWSLSTGAVTSRAGSQTNRDFAFAQGWWFSKGLSASLAQELDMNSGWKRSAGEPALSWTSTFATLRVPVTRAVALQSGYDNRRNVRLWRDRDTPETDFDDRYRQGAWGGISAEALDHVRSGFEVRTGSGGDHSDTWSWNGEVHHLSRWRAGVRARFSSFQSPGSESRLRSFGAGLDPIASSHFEFTLGSRLTRDRLSGVEERETWTGLDLDMALGGRWYVNGGWEHQSGLAGATNQLQAGVSVRL